MRNWQQLFRRITVGMILLCTVIFFKQNVSAASTYKPLFSGTPQIGDTVKYGTTTFRINSRYGVDLVRRDGTTETTILTSKALTNGKQAYSVKSNLLDRFVFKGNYLEWHREKILPMDWSWDIKLIRGKRVYLNARSLDKWAVRTYCYNLSTKKLSLVQKNCNIRDCSGSYVVAERDFYTGFGPQVLTLYKINSSTGKFVKVKTLTKSGSIVGFYGGKLYYTTYPNYKKYYMSKANLYCCQANGSKNVKLGAFVSKQKEQTVYVEKLYKNGCDLRYNGGTYRYTYATKKLKKIK